MTYTIFLYTRPMVSSTVTPLFTTFLRSTHTSPSSFSKASVTRGNRIALHSMSTRGPNGRSMPRAFGIICRSRSCLRLLLWGRRISVSSCCVDLWSIYYLWLPMNCLFFYDYVAFLLKGLSVINYAIQLLSPVKTRGYRVELVRLSVRPSVRPSVCPSVCPAWYRVLCPREFGIKELN